jgi:hypothetical protein
MFEMNSTNVLLQKWNDPSSLGILPSGIFWKILKKCFLVQQGLAIWQIENGNRHHLSSHIMGKLRKLDNVKTPQGGFDSPLAYLYTGKGRAWIRLSLNEGLLDQHLNALLNNTEVSKYGVLFSS